MMSVLNLFKITLLSNATAVKIDNEIVLNLFKITLLSNVNHIKTK